MDTIGDTHVRLYPLSLVDEGEEVLIGRMEVESYAVFPGIVSGCRAPRAVR